mmetsp:Transcript_17706/g.29540  ORF Transcript_17706/g.29540 Transcript_17706/m.29540 type:complete len:494 (-) Transcript_17706:302-1783(-)
MRSQQNWSANVTYGCTSYHEPESIEELQRVVRDHRRVRVVGTRHSFSNVADTDGALISLQRMPKVFGCGQGVSGQPTITCSAGTTCAELSKAAREAGLALPTLASLPHISIAGAIATATHGSGVSVGNFASMLKAAEYVNATGTLLKARRGSERLQGLLLGGIGVVTTVSLVAERTFRVRQDVYCGIQWTTLEAHFDDIIHAAYSVSLFTRWGAEGITQLWLKRRIPPGTAIPAAERTLYGARKADEQLHPVPGMAAAACTHQGEPAGPWCDRLPHFRSDNLPSSRGDELQSEYFVRLDHALAAIRAVRALEADVAPALQISEIRIVAADHFWLSPCCDTPSVALHFTWHRDLPALTRVLQKVETALKPFGARPHWGKLFLASPVHLYPKLEKYRMLLEREGARDKFTNAFMDEHIFQVTAAMPMLKGHRKSVQKQVRWSPSILKGTLNDDASNALPKKMLFSDFVFYNRRLVAAAALAVGIAAAVAVVRRLK